MQEQIDVLELQAKLAKLEAGFRTLDRRRRIWRWGTVATIAVSVSFSLAAQNSQQQPLTLQSLAKRVTDLESRVAADEASGTNIPTTADNGSSQSSSKSAGSSSADNGITALQQRVSTLEGNVSGLMDLGIQQRFVNDELTLAHIQQALNSLKGQSGGTVHAPFQVLGASGKAILTVEERDGEPFLHVDNAAGEQIVRIITAASGSGLVRVGASGGNNYVYLGGDSNGHALVSVTDDGDHAALTRSQRTNALGVYVGKTGEQDVSLDLEDGVGHVHVYHGTDEVIDLKTSSGGHGLLEVNSGSGSGRVEMGVLATGGYVTVSSTGGERAFMGAPKGKEFGFRLYPGSADTAVAGMIEDSQGNATIGISKNDIWRVDMAVGGASGIVGVLDNSGKKYLSALTNYPGGGGSLQVANPSGQIVSLVDANPTNNEGRAVFTDNGGVPLAKIGAAGPHGDVQLFGQGKGVDLWIKGLIGLP